MTRRLLDLFCGAGGAAMGYHRAGFEVVGVDIKPQPHYPFEFHQGDAMTWPLEGFDVIHASPPCQAYSITRHAYRADDRPALVPAMKKRLQKYAPHWVMENVQGAPMDNALVLCGSAFGLVADDVDGRPLYLKRHRLFESDRLLFGLPCQCKQMKDAGRVPGGVYGGGSQTFEHARMVRKGGYTPPAAVRRELMGIDWMPQDALSQAIPPAYTEWIGRQL